MPQLDTITFLSQIFWLVVIFGFFYLKEKHGLQSPLAKWMKNELQPFIRDILSESYYEGSKKIFNFAELQKLIKKHKESYYNPDLLWSCVCLQVFFRKFRL